MTNATAKLPEPASVPDNATRIAAACRRIENSETVPGLDHLARSAGMSRFHFQRVFKSITGLTPKQYAVARRSERVRLSLNKDTSVTEAIYDAGFNSSGRFYENVSHALGMTPSRFRSGGPSTTIHFAVGQCSLGAILVAQTEKGVCAIEIGDDPDVLVRDLQDRFPRANLIGDRESYADLVAKVVGFIDNPDLGLDLPLDLQGTAFQKRVWNALRQIPPGSTITYTELAARIGTPKAVRAVARACAANRIAIAIPCHRVIRTDGSLSGYRWGVERKSALVQKEAAQEFSKRHA
jgi:AraC family transcriptional regulator of adaptative response/methylated-DNA-[protein]-cysteine methyltransferase